MEVIPIPCPHFQITITQRSKGQSAVAGAAYQSGEKLFSEYDQKTKNYSGKRGILYTEIMLPAHAPPEYANRETLWNSVEAAEKQWNAHNWPDASYWLCPKKFHQSSIRRWFTLR